MRDRIQRLKGPDAGPVDENDVMAALSSGFVASKIAFKFYKRLLTQFLIANRDRLSSVCRLQPGIGH